MAQSLTDWLQQSRLIVVEVQREKGRIRVKGEGEVCSDLSCGEGMVYVADEAQTGGPALLNPGDIIRIEKDADRQDRIVVVRRVWDELTSPEF